MSSNSSAHVYKWLHRHAHRRRIKADWGLVLRWSLATCAGGTLSWVVSYALAFLIIVGSYRGIEQADSAMSVGLNALGIAMCLLGLLCLTFGFSVGLAQSIVMSKRPNWTHNMSVRWTVASITGWVLAFILTVVSIGGLNSSVCFSWLLFGVAGLVLGRVQWYALRRYVHGWDS